MKDKILHHICNWRMIIPVIFLYLEIVFHLYMKLDMAYFPVFAIMSFAIGMFVSGILYFLPLKAAITAGAAVTVITAAIFVIECICRDILQQYYQIFSAIDTAAGNRLTDYSSAVIQSVSENAAGILLMLAVPVVLLIISFKYSGNEENIRKAAGIIVLCFALLIYLAGYAVITYGPWKGDFTPSMLYRTDTNTDDQVEQLGVITMLRINIRNEIFGVPETDRGEVSDSASEAVSGEKDADAEENVTAEAEPEPDYPYNVLDIDLKSYAQNASSSNSKWLSEYFDSVVPTRQNEYTGMFEGYNVIFITAEGFSGYMIDPELTPTLYRMSHEGFVFPNFYSTLHFTSTSGGEFQNLTGLYPKAGFPVSMTETGEQGTYLPFTLANQLNRKGYTSIGYHFNQNMYGRELSHPNLGMEWRQFTECSRPLSAEVNSSGNAYWPQSDNYMIEQTFDDYKDSQPFNIYYLTISGHLPYGFSSSQMASRNREAVEDLPYSETTKAYIAANLELEKGLTTLINDLEEAGIADNTLIVMAPDHIPYSDIDVLEELAGRSFNSESLENLDEKSVDTDVYKNTLIIWSASMEQPVQVDKPCSQVDILPTVSNLLGLEYDSRMMAGTDVMSETDPIVIFFSTSWLTERGSYNRYTGGFTPAEGENMSPEEQDAYVENIKYIVDCRLDMGAMIIEEDYYRQVLE